MSAATERKFRYEAKNGRLIEVLGDGESRSILISNRRLVMGFRVRDMKKIADYLRRTGARDLRSRIVELLKRDGLDIDAEERGRDEDKIL